MNPDLAYPSGAENAQAYVGIMHTLSVYHIGLDDGDFEMVGRTFAEDALLEQSNGNQVLGRAAICEAFRFRREKRFENVDREAVFQRHNLTTRFIEIIDDGEATATSYFLVTSEIGLDHSGRYFDRLSRCQAGWRITHRKISIDWMHEGSRFNRPWPSSARL